MLEDNLVKSLGILDEDSKKAIWHSCISGSQIKNLFFNMLTVYNEKKVLLMEKVFSEKATKKMAMGRKLESVIRQLACEEFGLDIKTAPETYAITGNPFFTANIDGYIQHEDGIEVIEIKNTEEDNIDKVYEFYKYQIQYYMWFFNTSRARLIILSKGYNLQQKEVEPDIELQKEIVDRCNAMCVALNMGELDPKYFGEEDTVKVTDDTTIVYTETEDELSEKITKLGELKEKIKELEELANSLEQELKDSFAGYNKKVTLATPYWQYDLTTTTRQGNINYKDLITRYNIPQEEVESYRGRETQIIRGTLKKRIDN